MSVGLICYYVGVRPLNEKLLNNLEIFNEVCLLAGGYILVGFTVGITLIGVVLWGTLVGSMLPLLLKRLGADPAASSTPFVATLVDVTGLIIYFSVAFLILSGKLL